MLLNRCNFHALEDHFMFRLLIGIAIRLFRTGFTGRLLLLFCLVLLVSYIVRVFSELGKQG